MSLTDRVLFGGMRVATAATRAILSSRTGGSSRAVSSSRTGLSSRQSGRERPGPPPAEGPLRVLFLAGRPRNNAGTRYRLANWAARLRQLGHVARVDVAVEAPRGEALYRDWSARARAEYHVRALHSRLQSVRRAGCVDVVVLHLSDLPHWEYGRPFVAEALRRVCGRVLLDLDDLPVVRGETTVGERARALVGEVDGLLLGNRELFTHFGERPAWRIPTCVEPERLQSVADRPPSPRPVLGWIGTRGMMGPLERLAPVLQRVCERHGAVVRVICDRPPELPGVPVEFVPWSAESEGASVAGFDVGLAPLDDGPMERCKCGLKALQYMGAGMPVVASPVGVLAEIVEPGRLGAHATDAAQWESALGALLQDADARVAMGLRARAAVEERWSYSAHEARFVEALRGVSPEPPQTELQSPR